MGAQLSKGGVAVEGKAAADPAAAKANGQVSKAGPVRPSISGEPHGTRRPLAAWVPRWGGLAVAPSRQGLFIAVGGKHLNLA